MNTTKENSRKILKQFTKYSGIAWLNRTISRSILEIENDLLRKQSNIDPSVILRGKIFVSDKQKFSVGEKSVINDNSYFESGGSISIGRYVHMGRSLTIWTLNHNYKKPTKIPYDEVIIEEEVFVEDFVWMGANVSIAPGVTIKEGAIIGMGSVVVDDVPRCAIIGGNPARILSFRDIELFDKLKSEGKYF